MTDTTPKPIGRSLLLAFVVLVAVFAMTHFARFPGSLAYFKEVTGGQKILDLEPSFHADDVYARLHAMGDAGRDAYLRLIPTIDIVFPLAMFVFLVLWTRWCASKHRPPREGRVLAALPWIYIAADFVENAFVLAMLLAWPDRLTPLAATIGAISAIKRVAMMGALFLPPLTAMFATARRRWWPRATERL